MIWFLLVFLYNPLTKAIARSDKKLMNNRVRVLHQKFNLKTGIQLFFDEQKNSTDCLLWSLRFIANVGDGFEYQKLGWEPYNKEWKETESHYLE
jgi:hypothetical protein